MNSRLLRWLVIGFVFLLHEACSEGSPQKNVGSAGLADIKTSQAAAQILMSVRPRNSSLTLSQTQQFSAPFAIGSAIHWSVDGIIGGSSGVGKITGGGLYLPPANPGSHVIRATIAADINQYAEGVVAVTDLKGVYTYHNDLARTGQNLNEYALTIMSVSSGQFGLRWSCLVDGDIYAQILYVANLPIDGTTHNVLLVATQHNSVYAIDADDAGCQTYWQVSFLSPGVTPMSAAESQCDAIRTEIGITGTPVVDPKSGTLYVAAASMEGGNFSQKLHALDITNGHELAGSPVDIQAHVTNSSGDIVRFSPSLQLQRAALALSGGGLYVAYASYCDKGQFWGWVFRFDVKTLALTATFNAAPSGGGGGIWMSGGAPAIDSYGNIYVTTGNGSFNNINNILPAPLPFRDFGESILKLDANSLDVRDFYTPTQEAVWSSGDEDISSSGVTLLPDGIGPPGQSNLLVAFDKLAHLWLINRDNMQGFHSSGDRATQYLTLPECNPAGSCVMATPTYWNHTVYVAATGGSIVALPLVQGRVVVVKPPTVHSIGSAYTWRLFTREKYKFPAPIPVVSASPSGGAILWALDNSTNGTYGSTQSAAILRAYNASDLSNLLYSSSAIPSDAGAIAVKFAVPTVANGHVYVGGGGQVAVYGLAP